MLTGGFTTNLFLLFSEGCLGTLSHVAGFIYPQRFKGTV